MKTFSVCFRKTLYTSIHSLTDNSECQMEAEWRSPRELGPHNDGCSTKECLLMVALGAFGLVGHHSPTTSSQTGNQRENSSIITFSCTGKTAVSLKVNLKCMSSDSVGSVSTYRF